MTHPLVRMEVAVSPSQIGGTWLQRERLSTHMSGFPRHAESRATWRGQHERVVVRLHTADGYVGVGATRGTAAATLLVEHLGPLLHGRSAQEHDQLYAELAAAQLTYGPSGVGAAALSAVDLALWDLRASIAGVPLGVLLAGDRPVRADLPCYTTVHPERVPEAVGYAGVKIAARFGPLDSEDAAGRAAADIRRVRARVPAGTLVMVDTACSWTADFTIRVLDHLGDGELDWLEDALLPWDRDGYARVAAHLGSWDRAPRICLGNYTFSELEGHQVLADGVVDVLQPDLTWVGGLTAALSLQRAAAHRGVGFSPHYGAMHPWAVHLLATLPGQELAEHVAVSDRPVRDDFPDLPLPVAGRQAVPRSPGAAARVEPALLAAAAVHTVPLT